LRRSRAAPESSSPPRALASVNWPLTVLISPLCANHPVRVCQLPAGTSMVEKRWCPAPMRASTRASAGPGSNGRTMVGRPSATLVDHGAGGHDGTKSPRPCFKLQGLDLVAGGLCGSRTVPLQRIWHHMSSVFASGPIKILRSPSHARAPRGDIGISRSTGTSRQPRTDLALGAPRLRSASVSQAGAGLAQRGRKTIPTPIRPGADRHPLFNRSGGNEAPVTWIRIRRRSRQGVGGDRAPVVQVVADQQRVFDHLVCCDCP